MIVFLSRNKLLLMVAVSNFQVPLCFPRSHPIQKIVKEINNNKNQQEELWESGVQDLKQSLDH